MIADFASPGPTASFGNGFNLNGNASYIVRLFCASWLQIASVLDAPSIEYRILHKRSFRGGVLALVVCRSTPFSAVSSIAVIDIPPSRHDQD